MATIARRGSERPAQPAERPAQPDGHGVPEALRYASAQAKMPGEYIIEKSEASRRREAERDLQERFPDVEFTGDPLNILIASDVVIDYGARIVQVGENEIHISSSRIAGGAVIAHNAHQDGGAGFIHIADSTLESGAEVRGIRIKLLGTRVEARQLVRILRDGDISIEHSTIGGHVLCSGSNDRITIKDSITSSIVKSEHSSGAQIVLAGSEVHGSVSVCGSGSIRVMCSTITPSGNLFANDGDIEVVSCQIRSPMHARAGMSIRQYRPDL